MKILFTARLAIVSLSTILLSCTSQPEQSTSSNQETVAQAKPQEVQNRKTILFFGNSITAGYQLDMDEAFPALIQSRLDSLGYNYQVINAGLSGETTAGGLSRIFIK